MKQMFSLRDNRSESDNKISSHFATQKKYCLLHYIVKTVLLCIVASLVLCSCGSSSDGSHEPMKGVVREKRTSEEVKTEVPEPEVTKKGITVCVDPGHGYGDGGTSSTLIGDVLEKDITLSVAKKLKVHLESYGFDVIMTHDGIKFPKAPNDDGNELFRPEERAAYANSLGDKIDYYISVHCNSFTMPEVYGAEVFYVDDSIKGTNGDTAIAMALAGQLTSDFPEWKANAKTFPYYVIRYTKVPASLIEMGYVTNEGDAKKLLDEEWQEKFALSLAKGLNSYFLGSLAEPQ